MAVTRISSSCLLLSNWDLEEGNPFREDLLKVACHSFLSRECAFNGPNYGEQLNKWQYPGMSPIAFKRRNLCLIRLGFDGCDSKKIMLEPP